MNVTIEQAQHLYPFLDVWNRPEVMDVLIEAIANGEGHIDHRNGNVFWVDPQFDGDCELNRLDYDVEVGLHRITYDWDDWDEDEATIDYDTTALKDLHRHLNAIVENLGLRVHLHREEIVQHLKNLGREEVDFANFHEYQILQRIERRLERARQTLTTYGDNMVALSLALGEIHDLASHDAHWAKPIEVRMDEEMESLARRFPVEPYDRD